MKVIHGRSADSAASHGAVGGPAICQETTGSTGIFMACYRVPPGGRSVPHYHVNCETAVYVLSGHAHAYAGDDLSEMIEVGPGDLVYLPPEEIHQVANASDVDWLDYVVARNAPEEVVVEVTPGQAAAPAG